MTRTIKRDIPGIDIFKFLMALAVVLDHFAAIFLPDENAIPVAIRWAMKGPVPFFFITTGFLTYGIFDDKEKLLRRGLRLLRIWALWILIYLPTDIFSGFGSSTQPLRTIISLVVEGVTTYSWPLWFLYAMAWFFVIESFLQGRPVLKRISRIVYFVSFMLYSYGLYHYDYWLHRLIVLTPIKVFYGSQLILFGYYLKRWLDRAQGGTAVLTASLAVSSIVLFAFNLPCWNTLCGAAFFMVALRIKARSRKIYLMLRHESMWIYYLHMYILFAVLMLNVRGVLVLDLWPRLAVTFVAVFVLSWVLSRLQTRVKALAYLVR